MHAWSLKSTSHLRFQLVCLTSLPGLQRLDGALMDPMWNYDKLLVIFLSYLHEVAQECQEFKLSFCGPQANGLLSILWLCHECFSV